MIFGGGLIYSAIFIKQLLHARSCPVHLYTSVNKDDCPGSQHIDFLQQCLGLDKPWERKLKGCKGWKKITQNLIQLQRLKTQLFHFSSFVADKFLASLCLSLSHL